jgi:hypothetical protein
MSTTEILTDSIYKQFEANKRLNLFYEDLSLQDLFLEETKQIIQKHKGEILRIDHENQSGNWIRLLTDKALQIFCLNNQFLNLRESHTLELNTIYTVLWKEIIEELKSEDINFDNLQKAHFSRLTNWLMRTNGFVKDINDTKEPQTIEVVCSEYSAEFQLKILDITLTDLIEPVLDLGCGQSANLVHYLRKKGINAYGMDRIILHPNEHLLRCDWLDYDFEPHHWGTIISNLSFALHFANHHGRKDSDYILYAQKYMEILDSLKPSGSFCYAPGLPFIEAYLPKEKYKVTSQMINDEFTSTKIIRL